MPRLSKEKKEKIYKQKLETIAELKKEFSSIHHTHLSKKLIKKLDCNKKHNKNSYHGFYYSKNFERFIEGYDYHYDCKYMYGLKFNNKKIYTSVDKPDNTLILNINTVNEADKYIDKYILSFRDENDNDNSYLHWNQLNKSLFKDFAGIEFNVELTSSKKYKEKYAMYEEEPKYGMIWNTDIIDKLILMKKI
jgi:hypothetical protein